MSPLTEQQLLQILPNARPVVGIFVPALNRAMARFGIDNRLRAAAFIAQVGHESGHLRVLAENLNYKPDALLALFSRSRISEASARAFGRIDGRPANQPAIANCIYGGAWGATNLGNKAEGDGWRYRGRGLIQLTGLSNYRAAAAALGQPLVDKPELLEQPEVAAQSAAWWWSQRGLNKLADAGSIQDIGSIINTGQSGRVPHGADERRAVYKRALEVLQ